MRDDLRLPGSLPPWLTANRILAATMWSVPSAPALVAAVAVLLGHHDRLFGLFAYGCVLTTFWTAVVVRWTLRTPTRSTLLACTLGGIVNGMIISVPVCFDASNGWGQVPSWLVGGGIVGAVTGSVVYGVPLATLTFLARPTLALHPSIAPWRMLRVCAWWLAVVVAVPNLVVLFAMLFGGVRSSVFAYGPYTLAVIVSALVALAAARLTRWRERRTASWLDSVRAGEVTGWRIALDVDGRTLEPAAMQPLIATGPAGVLERCEAVSGGAYRADEHWRRVALVRGE